MNQIRQKPEQSEGSLSLWKVVACIATISGTVYYLLSIAEKLWEWSDPLQALIL